MFRGFTSTGAKRLLRSEPHRRRAHSGRIGKVDRPRQGRGVSNGSTLGGSPACFSKPLPEVQRDFYEHGRKEIVAGLNLIDGVLIAVGLGKLIDRGRADQASGQLLLRLLLFRLLSLA